MTIEDDIAKKVYDSFAAAPPLLNVVYEPPTFPNLLAEINAAIQGFEPGTVHPGWPPFAVWQRRQRLRRSIRRIAPQLAWAAKGLAMRIDRGIPPAVFGSAPFYEAAASQDRARRSVAVDAMLYSYGLPMVIKPFDIVRISTCA